MKKLFHKLFSLEKALEIIEQKISLKPRGTEIVNILDSLGRVLATDVYSPIDYPPFDRSEVDGYAVRAEDTYGAYETRPIRLHFLGSVKVGEKPSYVVNQFTAIEIATGAIIPKGSNAIIMEEYTNRKNGYVEIYRSVSPLENISVTGSDVSYGELVIQKGTRISSFEIGILAALGFNKIEVYLKPRIAVISTGNEIVAPGARLEYGQIYDYNGYAITAYLRSLGAEAKYLGIVSDDKNLLKNIIIENIKDNDIIVTSGGTSAGLNDVVYRVIEDIGEILVHGLEVKPGKPTVVGVYSDKLLVGLPGFPFSSTSISITLLRYIVEKLSGIGTPRIYSNLMKARITHRVRKDVGKTLYLPVVLSIRDRELLAIPIPYRSGNITPIIRADGIAVISKGTEFVEEGEDVDVILLRSEFPETLFIGSHDILLPLILRYIDTTNKTKIVSVGSLAGLINVAKGYGDVAPIHLLDPETNIYNLPYVMSYKDIVLVAGYRRKLVLAFQSNNPKNIRSIEDFVRSDVRIVNRNQGSGTRIFLDLMLRNIAKKLNISFDELTKKIDGYTYEVSSHTGVAAAIAQGRADAGICIEYAAKSYNLNYIPLSWEEYDFAIHKHNLTKHTVISFIEFLKSEKIIELIKSLPGYESKNNIGEIIYQ